MMLFIPLEPSPSSGSFSSLVDDLDKCPCINVVEGVNLLPAPFLNELGFVMVVWAIYQDVVSISILVDLNVIQAMFLSVNIGWERPLVSIPKMVLYVLWNVLRIFFQTIYVGKGVSVADNNLIHSPVSRPIRVAIQTRILRAFRVVSVHLGYEQKLTE